MHLTSRMENVTFLKLSEAGMFLSCTIKRFISKIDPAHGIFCFMMMLFRAGIFHFFALLTVLYPSEILSYAFSFILHPMTQILRLFFFSFQSYSVIELKFVVSLTMGCYQGSLWTDWLMQMKIILRDVFPFSWITRRLSFIKKRRNLESEGLK